MAGKKIDESRFIEDHLQPGTRLSVQCYFLYKVEKHAPQQELNKISALFNTSYYPIEPFYKPIHFYFDITKIINTDENAVT